MEFSVCLDAVYKGHDIVEAMGEVSLIGLQAFEFWSWWDKDIARICQAKNELGLIPAAICTRFISLVDESKRDEYLSGLQETLEVAKLLGCKTIISQVGDDLGTSRIEQKKNLVNGLKACVPMLEEADVQLVFEPLNVLVDHPGYFLTRSDEAFEIAEVVGSKYVKVLFDIYHQQITEGNVIQNIAENIDWIGHFHAAGNPGRQELTLGELNYAEILKAIDYAGYQAYMGLEYFPKERPSTGLRKLVS